MAAAMATFCWLPPDSDGSGARDDRVRTRKRCDEPVGDAPQPARAEEPARQPDLARPQADHEVLARPRGSGTACRAGRPAGTPCASTDGRARRTCRRRTIEPAVLDEPGRRRDDLASARALDADEREDLAPPDAQRHVPEPADDRRPVHIVDEHRVRRARWTSAPTPAPARRRRRPPDGAVALDDGLVALDELPRDAGLGEARAGRAPRPRSRRG